MLKSVREQERSPEGPGDVALSVSAWRFMLWEDGSPFASKSLEVKACRLLRDVLTVFELRNPLFTRKLCCVSVGNGEQANCYTTCTRDTWHACF